VVFALPGCVYTILRKEEVRHFKGLLHKVNNTFVKDHRLPTQLLEAAKPAAVHALQVLQAYLTAESP
jgi:ATP-dependent RNA helicase DDX51/DBP6